MPISISANVLALRHSWGPYGSRTTPACLRLFRTPGRHTDEPSSYSLVASPQARLRPESRWRGRRVGADVAAGLGLPDPAALPSFPCPPVRPAGARLALWLTRTPPPPAPAACAPCWPIGTPRLRRARCRWD